MHTDLSISLPSRLFRSAWMWSQTLGVEAETMLCSTTLNRPLPGATNKSASSFLPFPSLLPPSLKFSSLNLFTLNPCIKACPLPSSRGEGGWPSTCTATFWQDPSVENEKMVEWRRRTSNQRRPWKCGYEWSYGYWGGGLNMVGRHEWCRESTEQRRSCGERVEEEDGAGDVGTCETSLSVLIFPAERETDRKSIVSFFLWYES